MPSAFARSNARSADRPSSTRIGFIPQLVTTCSRIRRFVALSSTIRTVMSLSAETSELIDVTGEASV